jgi:hypothetical protein
LKFENVIHPDDRKAESLIGCGARKFILAFTGSRDGVNGNTEKMRCALKAEN